MQKHIVANNLEINKKHHHIIDTKLINLLEKHLTHLEDDLKLATIKVEKRTRWGYQISFDMILPGRAHIFAQTIDKHFGPAIIKLRQEVTRQITRHTAKLERNPKAL